MNALRAFEAAGRHGSIKLAADELGVTPGAVSRHITALEQQLGRPLFARQSRGLLLTDGGRRYLATLTGVFDQLALATEDLRQGDRIDKITMSAYSSFSAEWLLPRLWRFRRAHPDLSFSLVASHQPPALEGGAADIGIRLGHGHWPGLRADLLFEEIYVPVCSPALLENGPPLCEAADMYRHTLLYTVAQIPFWAAWFRTAGIEPPDLSSGLQFENAFMAYSAARGGTGVALGRRFMLPDDFQAGRLVVPVGPMLTTRRSHYLISLVNREREPAIRSFREWILTEAEATRQSPAPRLPNGSVLQTLGWSADWS